VFHPEKLGEMDAAVNAAIEDKQCPGGVLWFEREEAVYHKAYGNRALIPIVESMTEDTIFDAASLTKVMATAPAILLLIEQGRVGLDEPVNAFIPEFARDGRDAITVRHLLTHTSGLRPGIPAYPPWTGYEKAVQLACAEKPTAPWCTTRPRDGWAAWRDMRACSPPRPTSPASRACCSPAVNWTEFEFSNRKRSS
jgi:CubicO group peptidase (beta-lactamase class C family)